MFLGRLYMLMKTSALGARDPALDRIQGKTYKTARRRARRYGAPNAERRTATTRSAVPQTTGRKPRRYKPDGRALARSPDGRAVARPHDAWARARAPLLDLDFGADVLELLLDRRRFFLRDSFLNRLGRALDQVLRFLQAEARDLANDFDDIDLVAAHFGQGRRELGLLLGGSRCAAGCRAAAGYCHGHGRRRRHAELLLELLHELRELEDGDSLDVV